jgi:hypothetical protein
MSAEHWKCPDCGTWVPALREHRCPPGPHSVTTTHINFPNEPSPDDYKKIVDGLEEEMARRLRMDGTTKPAHASPADSASDPHAAEDESTRATSEKIDKLLKDYTPTKECTCPKVKYPNPYETRVIGWTYVPCPVHGPKVRY